MTALPSPQPERRRVLCATCAWHKTGECRSLYIRDLWGRGFLRNPVYGKQTHYMPNCTGYDLDAEKAMKVL